MNFSIATYCSLLLLATLLLSSCAKKGPAAPPAKYLKTSEEFSRPSVLQVPFSLPLSALAKELNAQVPDVLYDDNSLDDNGGDNLILKVKRRGLAKLDGKGNTFYLSLPVSVYAKAGWKVEKLGIKLSHYEDTDFDIDLKFAVQLGLNEQWQITSNTKSDGFTWVSKPKLKIGQFELPITGVVEKVLNYQLPQLTKMFDATLANEVKLKPLIQPVWKQVQQPLKVYDDPLLFVKIVPEEITYSPPVMDGKDLKIALGMRAKAITKLKTAPQVAEKPLPNLKLASTLAEQFQVTVMVETGYAEAAELAMKSLKGQVFSFGKKAITVDSLRLYGAENRLVAEVLLKGSFNGKVYLKGEPYFNKEAMALQWREVNYDLETSNFLLKTADWLAHGQFVKLLTPYMNVPLGKELQEAKASLEKQLNSPINNNVSLQGKVDQLTVEDILITPEAMQALIKSEGKLRVQLTGLR